MSLLKVNDVQDTGGSSLIGRKNYIINGNFDVWQRGTSIAASGYLADRWNHGLQGSSLSASQQTFTVGQTDVPDEPKYFLRSVVTTASAASGLNYVWQKIEGVRSLAGQSVTISFYAKADSAKDICVDGYQNFGTGSPTSEVLWVRQTISLTTAWQKHTISVTIPSITGASVVDGTDHLQLRFWFEAGSDYAAFTNSLGNQSGTFDIAQVQLEKGSSATQFEHRSYGEELALCQRYYETSYNKGVVAGTATSLGAIFTGGTATVTTFCVGGVGFKVKKRAVPSMVVYDTFGNVNKCTREEFGVAQNSNSIVVSANVGEANFVVYSNSGAAANSISLHFTADAEL